MEKLLLSSRFSITAGMLKLLTKTFGHHYIVHHGTGIPMLYGSYWSTVRTRGQSWTTTGRPCILRLRMEKLLLSSRFSITARMLKLFTKTFGHHYIVHHGTGIPMLCGSYWSTVRIQRQSWTTTGCPFI